jgi:DNA-binding transcriptional regulator YhcF (GntR family)
VADVYSGLLERIGSGTLAVGARLPSVRRLAIEIGSNPSTVDRALQRLARDGLVRTVPRRGTFVTATEPPALDPHTLLAGELDRLVGRARALGLPDAALRGLFDTALAQVGRQPLVAFVECNEVDLRHMATTVENATGVDLVRVLLADAPDRLDEAFDVVAAPLFHLPDLFHRVDGLDRVVELNFVPDSAGLRRLATLDPGARVTVAAPTARGLERFSAVVRQYHPGEVDQFLVGGAPLADLEGVDVLVHGHAAQLPAEVVASARRQIVLEWELEPGSAAAFRPRVDGALRRWRAAS